MTQAIKLKCLYLNSFIKLTENLLRSDNNKKLKELKKLKEEVTKLRQTLAEKDKKISELYEELNIPLGAEINKQIENEVYDCRVGDPWYEYQFKLDPTDTIEEFIRELDELETKVPRYIKIHYKNAIEIEFSYADLKERRIVGYIR